MKDNNYLSSNLYSHLGLKGMKIKSIQKNFSWTNFAYRKLLTYFRFFNHYDRLDYRKKVTPPPASLSGWLVRQFETKFSLHLILFRNEIEIWIVTTVVIVIKLIFMLRNSYSYFNRQGNDAWDSVNLFLVTIDQKTAQTAADMKTETRQPFLQLIVLQLFVKVASSKDSFTKNFILRNHLNNKQTVAGQRKLDLCKHRIN